MIHFNFCILSGWALAWGSFSGQSLQHHWLKPILPPVSSFCIFVKKELAVLVWGNWSSLLFPVDLCVCLSTNIPTLITGALKL